MSDLFSIFLLAVAAIAAAVVWMPRFSMPLSFDIGMSLCALGLAPLADAIRGGRGPGFYPTTMILAGLAMILWSYRRARTARNTGEPHVIDAGDLRKVGGGRKP